MRIKISRNWLKGFGCGIAAITIWPDTAQLYKGEADWSLIGEVKRNPRIKIPVIGNG